MKVINYGKFDARMFINHVYEHVEDKPGFVWLNKKHTHMISINMLVAYLEGRLALCVDGTIFTPELLKSESEDKE